VKVCRLTIENFRGVRKAELHFHGHTLLVGENNVGKSTVCEALDLVLGPDRLRRLPPVEEYDFYNAGYLGSDGRPNTIRIEVLLTDLSPEVQRRSAANLEYWKKSEHRLLAEGEIADVDRTEVQPCLRLLTTAEYDPEEDQFGADTFYAHSPDAIEGELTRVPQAVKRALGFIYLRALRTGARALSLERGSLLDTILRMKEIRTDLWEKTRRRLRELDPPIEAAADELGPILETIEQRLGEYIPRHSQNRSTRLFVSQLTREHLRKTISFFLSMAAGQEPVPFHEVGAGTLNTLVLALLTFIAEIKKENVIFAMEEPEIALPPHTQRRIIKYLLTETTQCFVTSHSPYVIERFEPDQLTLLRRDSDGTLSGTPVVFPVGFKSKTYRSQVRRFIAEAILGRGVIIGEGLSEQLTLTAIAQKLEEADPTLFPLDVAGVSIANAGGDGSLGSFGAFFKSLGLATFAFYDQRKRKAEEVQRIKSSFDAACEAPYKGIEALLAAEIPADCVWTYLETVRDGDEDGRYGIPAERPDNTRLQELIQSALKGAKGEGGAATLIELCSSDQLPPTITEFLRTVYQRFPRPGRRETSSQPESDPSKTVPRSTEGDLGSTQLAEP